MVLGILGCLEVQKLNRKIVLPNFYIILIIEKTTVKITIITKIKIFRGLHFLKLSNNKLYDNALNMLQC